MKKNIDSAMMRAPEERYISNSTEQEEEQQTELSAEDDFNGNLNVKIPRSLHAQLNEEAQREGVSMDQYVIYKLTR